MEHMIRVQVLLPTGSFYNVFIALASHPSGDAFLAMPLVLSMKSGCLCVLYLIYSTLVCVCRSAWTDSDEEDSAESSTDEEEDLNLELCSDEGWVLIHAFTILLVLHSLHSYLFFTSQTWHSYGSKCWRAPWSQIPSDRGPHHTVQVFSTGYRI